MSLTFTAVVLILAAVIVGLLTPKAVFDDDIQVHSKLHQEEGPDRFVMSSSSNKWLSLFLSSLRVTLLIRDSWVDEFRIASRPSRSTTGSSAEGNPVTTSHSLNQLWKRKTKATILQENSSEKSLLNPVDEKCQNRVMSCSNNRQNLNYYSCRSWSKFSVKYLFSHDFLQLSFCHVLFHFSLSVLTRVLLKLFHSHWYKKIALRLTRACWTRQRWVGQSVNFNFYLDCILNDVE